MGNRLENKRHDRVSSAFFLFEGLILCFVLCLSVVSAGGW